LPPAFMMVSCLAYSLNLIFITFSKQHLHLTYRETVPLKAHMASVEFWFLHTLWVQQLHSF
jgi:hypothetical protein